MPSALDYLRITPPGNPLSQFFPQQGGDDAFRARLEERPSNASAIPQEYQIAGMLPDPGGFMERVQKIRGDLQTRKAIKGISDLEFGSKDYSPSVARLISKYPLASQNPAFLNILKMKEFSGTQAKDKNFNDLQSKAIKDFYLLDPSDEKYPENFRSYIEALDPSVQSSPGFDRILETGRNHVEAHRSKRNMQAEEAHKLGLQLAEAGIPPEQFDRYKSEDGSFDPYKTAYALGQAKRGLKSDAAQMSPKQREQLADTFQKLHEPASDEEALDAYNLANKTSLDPKSWFHKPTPKQIEEGRALAQHGRVKATMSKLSAMHQAGVSLPEAIQSYLDGGIAPQQPALQSTEIVSPPTVQGAAPVAPVAPVASVVQPAISPTGPQPLSTDPSQLPPMGVLEQRNLMDQNRNINESNTAKSLTDQAWTEAKGKIGDLINLKWPDPKERLNKLISIYKASKGLTGLTGLKNLHGIDLETELAPEYRDISVQYPKGLEKIPHHSFDDVAASLGRILPGTGTPREVLYAHAADELAKAGYLDAKGNLIAPALKSPLKKGQKIEPAPGIEITHVGE